MHVVRRWNFSLHTSPQKSLSLGLPFSSMSFCKSMISMSTPLYKANTCENWLIPAPYQWAGMGLRQMQQCPPWHLTHHNPDWTPLPLCPDEYSTALGGNACLWLLVPFFSRLGKCVSFLVFRCAVQTQSFALNAFTVLIMWDRCLVFVSVECIEFCH